MLEYACQVFHRSLPSCLSDEIEGIQRRAMRTVFPDCKYSVALERAGIPTLSARRESLCLDLFSNIVQDKNHKLADLLPPKSTHIR